MLPLQNSKCYLAIQHFDYPGQQHAKLFSTLKQIVQNNQEAENIVRILLDHQPDTWQEVLTQEQKEVLSWLDSVKGGDDQQKTLRPIRTLMLKQAQAEQRNLPYLNQLLHPLKSVNPKTMASLKSQLAQHPILSQFQYLQM